MRPSAGRRDTLIMFLSRAAAQDPVYGTSSGEWADFVDAWAEVEDMIPSRGERIAEGISIQQRPCRIRMGWRDDITSDMRVRIGPPGEPGTRILEIAGGPAELGRREGLEMVCIESSTQGDAP